MHRTRPIRGALLAAALAGLALSACNPASPRLAIRTAAAPAQACDAALLAGSLVRQPQTGLGIAQSDVEISAVEWPFGYTARTEGGLVVLLDETGKVVAREHDRVSVSGGSGSGPGGISMWFACGDVSVVSNEGG